MVRKHGDVYVGFFLLAFSAVMFIATFNIVSLTEGQVASDFMPRVISILIAIFSISIIVSGFRGRSESAATVEQAKIDELPEQEKTIESKKEKSYLSVILTVALMLVYLFLLPVLGFLVATIIYLFLQMLIFSVGNAKKLVLYLILSVVTSCFIYYVFRNLFYVMLPSGILG